MGDRANSRKLASLWRQEPFANLEELPLSLGSAGGTNDEAPDWKGEAEMSEEDSAKPPCVETWWREDVEQRSKWSLAS